MYNVYRIAKHFWNAYLLLRHLRNSHSRKCEAYISVYQSDVKATTSHE